MNGILCALTLVSIATGYPPPNHPAVDDYRGSLVAARAARRPMVVVIEDQTRPDGRLKLLASEKPSLLPAFQLCRVNAATPYGKKVADSYGATKLPYTVITDRDSRRIMFRGVGQLSQSKWKNILRTYADPEPTHATKPQTDAEDHRVFTHRDLESAQSAAKQKNRSVLVFVTMNGCHYCHKMQREALEDADVCGAIDAKFESVIIFKEKYEEWVEEKGVKMYPTTLMLNQQGELVDRIEGYVSVADLKRRLKHVGQQLAGLP